MATNNLIGFAKFFTNLSDEQEKELERVLLDLQNSKEITSLETSLRQLKRKVNQNLPIPELTVRPTPRGASIEWKALPDQRISFYEVEIGDTSTFASFTTVPTYGLISVVDGLSETKFVRVRGVRRDGTTSPFSDIVEINPTLFDVQTHTDEAFYIQIIGTSTNTVLGGAGSDLDYKPINPDGNSLVWGFISMYGDPAVAMFGSDEIIAEVKVKIINEFGATVSDDLFWENTISEYFQSEAVGPFTVPHPPLNSTIQIRLDITDSTTKQDGTTRTADSTEMFWGHLQIFEIGST